MQQMLVTPKPSQDLQHQMDKFEQIEKNFEKSFMSQEVPKTAKDKANVQGSNGGSDPLEHQAIAIY